MTSRPVTHAVVLNWRDTIRTLECIGSLQSQPGLGTIWVIDNEATGELASSAIPHGVKIIELQENRGFAAGVNVGIAAALAAGAGNVLVVNNDSMLEPGALAHMSLALELDRHLGAVGPQIVDANSGRTTAGSRVTFTCRTKELRTPQKASDYLTWACVLLRGSALKSVGLLDESYFMYWEDAEYGYRLREAGWRVRVEPLATLVHATSSSHQKAGSIIAMYSTAGLTRFALARGGATLVFGLLRALARAARSTASLRLDDAAWHVRGIKLGWRVSRPIYPVVSAIRAEHEFGANRVT